MTRQAGLIYIKTDGQTAKRPWTEAEQRQTTEDKTPMELFEEIKINQSQLVGREWQQETLINTCLHICIQSFFFLEVFPLRFLLRYKEVWYRLRARNRFSRSQTPF